MNLLFLQDYDTMRAEKYDVIGNFFNQKMYLFLPDLYRRRIVDNLKEELTSQF